MDAAKRPSIFVGVSCYGTVAPEFLEDFGRFMFHLGRRMPEYDFFTGIVTKKEQFRARNLQVEGAIQMGCDYLLMLDDDMIINAWVTTVADSSYDFLRQLIAHDKDVIGVLYYQRLAAMAPVLMNLTPSGGYRFLRQDEIEHGLQKVDVAGGGCLLMKTRIFDRIQPPYFAPEFEYGTDIQVCRRAAEKGFTVWADTSIEIGHLRDERTIVTSRNRTSFLTEGIPGEVRKQFVMTDVYSRLLEDYQAYVGQPFEEMLHQVNVAKFLEEKQASGLSDLAWYRTHPKERITRQVWFNTKNENKRAMTELIVSSVDHRRTLDVLDFGCGIGIPAFTYADKGHRVTACDVRSTGTLDFLKWRLETHKLPATVLESETDVPDLGEREFDVIIAMDVLEHIKPWRSTLDALLDRLRPGGVFFCNNGILDDNVHPEHYRLANQEFLIAVLEHGVTPLNQITFVRPATIPQTAPVDSGQTWEHVTK